MNLNNQSSLLSRITSIPTPILSVVWTIQAWGLILITLTSFFPKFFHYQEYCFFSLLVLAVGATWWEGKSIWVRSPIDLPLLLFVGWVLFTIPFAIDLEYSFGEWRKLAAQVLVFYWTLKVLSTQENSTITNKILGAVIIGITIVSMFALIDFVLRDGSLFDRTVRAVAPFSGYQELSTYTVMAIPFLIVFLAFTRTCWQRVVSIGAVGLALLAQVFSYTRAGWLGMLAQAIGYGVFTRRRGVMLLLLAGFTVSCLGLFVVYQMDYHRDTFDPWTLNTRLAVWELGIHEMFKHPVVGLGYENNTFQPIIRGVQVEDSRMHLHNTFLMIGVGSGLPALLLLIWVLVEALRSLFTQALKVSDSMSVAIMIGTAIMIVGFAVRNFFDYMFAGSLAYLFWIFLAFGIIHCTKKNKVV